MFECPILVRHEGSGLPTLVTVTRGIPLHARQRGVIQNIEITTFARVISTIQRQPSNLIPCKLTYFKLFGVEIAYLLTCCFAWGFSIFSIRSRSDSSEKVRLHCRSRALLIVSFQGTCFSPTFALLGVPSNPQLRDCHLKSVTSFLIRLREERTSVM
jgi:hypothetical protein